MKWKVFKFEVECGRMGVLSGMFIATQEAVDVLTGLTLHFGDALGKHSDVTVEISPSMIQPFPDNLVKIDLEKVEEATGGDPLRWVTLSGYNPLEYVE